MSPRYGLRIRAAAGADAAGLSDLMRAAGRPVADGALAARLEALRPADGAALVAIEWGPPSGVVALNWCRTLDDDRPVAVLGLLLVGPDERRRGIGRTLLKAASQAARVAGCGTMLIHAAADPSLAAFCAATGFEPAGTLQVRPLRKKG